MKEKKIRTYPKADMSKDTLYVDGTHPFQPGINLHDLLKIITLKCVTVPLNWTHSPITSISTNPKKETVKAVYEMGESKVEYTFHIDSFTYHMTDLKEQPLRKPESARTWTQRSAMDWIQQANRRTEEAMLLEEVPKDAEWFIRMFKSACGRTPTTEEFQKAYAMCPIATYRRGLTKKEAEWIREKAILNLSMSEARKDDTPEESYEKLERKEEEE